MNENRMAEVARLFGKKLGEEFDVRFNGKLKCLMFDEQRGLLYFNGDEWRKNYAYLDWLVRGKAVIVDE
jgi:nitroimidazol reductase NimA-like FMN-containing flavoprotein (pyridoxamine 5'-phosphate oxidase superfamily)